MATPAPSKLQFSTRIVDRALRSIERSARLLRQRQLARRLGRTLSREHWSPIATDEIGLTAEELRRHATHLRRADRPLS